MLAFAAALVWRWQRSKHDEPAAPSKAPAPPAADARRLDAAVEPPPVAADAAIENAPELHTPVPDSNFTLVRLSSDGKHALLIELGSIGDTPQLRAVAVDTGAVEAQVELASFRVPRDDEPAQPPDPARKLADLTRARALLAGFPLGAGEIIAASPDGTRGAFNEGDYLHTMVGDKLGPRAKLPAAYAPMVLPDGKTLLMRGYAGEIDGPGTGKYGLFAMPLDGTKPVEIAGTEDMGVWVLDSGDAALRIAIDVPPNKESCVVEVPLAQLRVARRRCVAAGAHPTLSPHGDKIAWTTPLDSDADSTIGPPGKARQRIRVMDFATGAIELDVITPGFVTLSDSGHVVIDRFDVALDVVDGKSRTFAPTTSLASCLFRGAHELVCVHGDSVAVTDLSRR